MFPSPVTAVRRVPVRMRLPAMVNEVMTSGSPPTGTRAASAPIPGVDARDLARARVGHLVAHVGTWRGAHDGGQLGA